MSELKPCPFCGGEASVERIGGNGYYFVACSGLNCCDSALADTEAEAIAAWNTRYHSAFEETVIKAWKEIKDYQERTCHDTDENEWHFVCSACGYEQNGYEQWNYCPNCGARVIKSDQDL